MSLDIIDRLLAADAASPMRLAVIGDAMEDFYIHGTMHPSQDGVQKFLRGETVRVPGGAANAARQLEHVASQAWLVSPLPRPWTVVHGEAWRGFSQELCLNHCPDGAIPVKTRWLVDGRIVWRQDEEKPAYGLSQQELAECRRLCLQAVRQMRFDGVLISDYDKGWLDAQTIGEIVQWCNAYDVPVVADAKRSPRLYEGAVLKCNEAYRDSYPHQSIVPLPGMVITRGDGSPVIAGDPAWSFDRKPDVSLVSHVGAGDCFASWLLLGLVHGLSLADAATVAHSAGRVFVQHPHNRPPWPHEVRRDVDPVGGKVVGVCDLPALRESHTGRVVFTNGIFRIPHPGHVETLRWARQQGDLLVVGVNDDVSAFRARPEGYVMPLEGRLAMLAAMECVNYIVGFSEDDPCQLVGLLQPDVLVKGDEYRGRSIPGDLSVQDVRFAPPSTFGEHASDIERRIRG